MANITPNTRSGSLAYFVKETCWRNWKKNRKDLCEEKWQENLNAFKMISDGVWKVEEAEGWRSKTFIPLIKMKIIAAWSIIIDMLLMNNKIPFNLIPSPWDELTKEELPDSYQAAIDDEILYMKKTIDQQLEDCHADRELMKCLMADAIYGECYSKFFVHPVKRKGYKTISLAPEGYDDQKGEFKRFEPYETEQNAPGWEYVSTWSMYRDLETDDLQAGAGVIQHQLWSAYDLFQKKGETYYVDDGIDNAIKNAPKPDTTTVTLDEEGLPPGLRNLTNRYKNVDVLEFWGRVPSQIVEDFERNLAASDGVDTYTEYEHDGNEVEIMCVVAGDHVIRYARNEPNHRPFYRSVWEINLDHPTGTGPADNLKHIQLVLNGGVRAFEDNKKLSGNVMGMGNSNKAPNWDKKFKPGLFIDTDDTVDDVRKAFIPFIIPDVGDSLLGLINLFERYGDDASQMPKILQGAVLDKRKPDTFSELNMLQANAGKYIGGVIKNFDEGTLEPMCQDFYEYNMDDPDVQRGKGNFIAKALGYSSYQDRIVKLNKMLQALTIAMGNDLLLKEVKIREMLKVIYEALDVDTARVIKNDKERLAEMDAEANSMARQIEEMMLKLKVEGEGLANELKKAQIEKTKADTEETEAGTERESFKTGMDVQDRMQGGQDALQNQG